MKVNIIICDAIIIKLYYVKHINDCHKNVKRIIRCLINKIFKPKINVVR